MTRPNSSISSSSAALRYLLTLAAVAAVVLAGMAAIIIGTRAQGRALMHFETLVRYQMEKAEAGPVPHTLFVGDSSLGNAISARHWQELTGRPAMSLALTGFYGYGGSYNMMRRVLAHGRPANIVIVQTPDMMSREVEDMGYVMTAPGVDVPTWRRLKARFGAEWRLTMNAGEMVASLEWLADHALGRPPRPPEGPRIVDDYMAQGKPLKVSEETGGFSPGNAREDKLFYLSEIARLCAAEGLNCIYAHGPWAEVKCRKSQDYLAKVAQMVASVGLPLADGTPVCLPADQVGDAWDHVAPPYKQSVTDRYFQLLKPLLRLD